MSFVELTEAHPAERKEAQMKRLMIAGAVAVSVAGTLASAQGPSQETIEMKMMDTNGDGKLSPEEHAAGAKRIFEMMDADKNGMVTAAEMDANRARSGKKPAPGELSSAEKIKTIDTNGDGVLSAEEHAAGSKAMFDAMDTDKDGFVTLAELALGHQRMMKK